MVATRWKSINLQIGIWGQNKNADVGIILGGLPHFGQKQPPLRIIRTPPRPGSAANHGAL